MLRIVAAYQGMMAYISAARANPGADQHILWRQYVIDPYWDQWAAGEFNEERVHDQLRQPYLDLDGLEREVKGLTESGVEGVIAAAYAEKICDVLPYHDEDAVVCILAGNPQDSGLVEDLRGVVGTCVGGNTLLMLNPAGLDWLAMVPYVLAHERHHSAWGYHHYVLNHKLNPCLLASLVSEGSADVFAHQLYSDLCPVWTEVLTHQEEAVQWQTIQSLLFTADTDGSLHRRFFFGDSASGIPPFAGYTIGFHIVQRYVSAHPQESVASWTVRKPEEILAGSGYPG